MDPFFFSAWVVAFSRFSLDLVGASDSVKGAWEFDEERIANSLDLPSVVTNALLKGIGKVIRSSVPAECTQLCQ